MIMSRRIVVRMVDGNEHDLYCNEERITNENIYERFSAEVAKRNLLVFASEDGSRQLFINALHVTSVTIESPREEPNFRQTLFVYQR